MKGYTPDDDPPFPCPHCGRPFLKYEACHGHMTWCKKNPDRQIGRPGFEE